VLCSFFDFVRSLVTPALSVPELLDSRRGCARAVSISDHLLFSSDRHMATLCTQTSTSGPWTFK
jgi:hypothetical protein